MVKEGFFGSATKKRQSEGGSSPTKSFVSSASPSSSIASSSHFSKTPSSTSKKTPGKKLLKRLFCAPVAKSRDSFYAETSLEGPLDSNSTTGSASPPGDHPPRSITTATPSSWSSTSTNRNRDNLLPPAQSSVTRNNNSSNNMTVHNPTTVPLPETPPSNRGPLKQNISDILNSGGLSQHSSEEDVYLPQSSSSYSDENVDMNSATPDRHQFSASMSGDSSSFGGMPMKTPGMAIPTPQIKSARYQDDEENHTTSLVFPHPLRAVTESPVPLVTRHLSLSQSVSGSQESEVTPSTSATNEQDADGDDADDEDDAFLPDDFKQNKQLYTWEEVQKLIKEHADELQFQLDYRHQQELEDALEAHLREHGAQWKKDAEEEYARLNRMIKEEKSIIEQKNSELLELVTAMNLLESQASLHSKEKRKLEAKVQALEEDLAQGVSANDQAKELYLNQLQQQIQELQAELNEAKSNQPDPHYVQKLEASKADAERKVANLERIILQTKDQLKTMELNQQSAATDERNWDMLQAAHDKERKELESAHEATKEQVTVLKSQLDALRRSQEQRMPSAEELKVLNSEKAVLERKLLELQTHLNTRISAADEQIATLSAQLEDARNQIESLEEQMAQSVRASIGQAVNESAASEVSHAELFAAKAAVETLQVLREEDLKENKELKKRLHKMTQELMLSPRAKGRESKLEMGTTTMEVPPFPSNSMSPSFKKAEGDALVRLRCELESLRAERDALENQVRQLEQDRDIHSAEAVMQVRQELEKQIQVLKDELDRRSLQFETEKRSLQTDLSAQEIDELTSEVETLKDEHRVEMEEQRLAMKAEKDQALAEANARFEELRSGFEEEMVHLVEAHGKEKKALLSQIDKLKEQHRQQEDAKKEIESLQEKLDRLRIEFEDEKVEIIRTSSRQADELQTKLSMQQQEHEEALESLQQTIESLESEIASLRADTQSKEAFTVSSQYLEEMKAKYEEEMESLKSKSHDEAEKLEHELEVALTEQAHLESKIATLEKQLVAMTESHKKEIEEATLNAKIEMEKELQELEATVMNMGKGNGESSRQIAELQAKTKADQEEYARRIREVREEHNKEIDDLLKQLDLVEAEHVEKTSNMRQLVKEKEAVISALGAQLADAETRLSAATEEREALTRRVGELEEEVCIARAETESKAKEVKRLIAERTKAVEQEEILREKLCEAAREEMVQQAESQFRELNSTYKKLKHSYDEATAKIAMLDKELVAAKKRADQIKREKEAREEDLADELAQAKAAAATADLTASRKMKQYRSDLDKAKQFEKDLQLKLDEALATSGSVQRTLASVVAEKEKLLEENKEMKAVCEELMELVEQQGNSSK